MENWPTPPLEQDEPTQKEIKKFECDCGSTEFVRSDDLPSEACQCKDCGQTYTGF